VTCSKHGKITRLFEARHFDRSLAGGCDQPCGGVFRVAIHARFIATLPTIHKYHARQQCVRVLTCGHKCSKNCTAKCYCDACGLWDGQFQCARLCHRGHQPCRQYWASDTIWGESPTKSSMKKSAADCLVGKRVTFVAATQEHGRD